VYWMAVTAALVGAFAWNRALWAFVLIALGGVAMGLAVGFLVAAARRIAGRTAALQNMISLLTPFAAYLPADALHVSGVLSVVAAGLYLGRQTPRIITAETRIQARDTWEVMSHILESLTFLLVGLYLPYAREAWHKYPPLDLLRDVLAIVAAIVVARLLIS